MGSGIYHHSGPPKVSPHITKSVSLQGRGSAEEWHVGGVPPLHHPKCMVSYPTTLYSLLPRPNGGDQTSWNSCFAMAGVNRQRECFLVPGLPAWRSFCVGSKGIGLLAMPGSPSNRGGTCTFQFEDLVPVPPTSMVLDVVLEGNDGGMGHAVRCDL